MKRRDFLLTGTASAASLVLTACGGGGGGGGSASASGIDGSAVSSGAVGSYASVGSGAGYPFGSRKIPYAAGVRPSQSNATMDAMLKKQYDAWKAARVVSVPTISGGLAVRFSQANYITVSEAMGYGMLLAAVFAGHDANARGVFDGLLKTVRTRYAYARVNATYGDAGKYLMDWRLTVDGSKGDGYHAMDGDLDIALALLMADKQWGSSGTWNYLQEAKNTIKALKLVSMGADGRTKGLGYETTSRTSDWMIGHFRSFAAATGDAFWSKTAIDRAYYLADYTQRTHSPSAGLFPDFIIKAETNAPIPSTGGWGYGDGNTNANLYYWNACRNPWRFATDYVVSGDTRWKTVTSRLVDFFNNKFASSGDIMAAIDCGYNLSGGVISGGDSAAFIAPIMLGGCVDAKYQKFVDAAWNWNAAHLTTGYYDSEIQLLSMVVASGNWWTA
jgi:hypothetical protein